MIFPNWWLTRGGTNCFKLYEKGQQLFVGTWWNLARTIHLFHSCCDCFRTTGQKGQAIDIDKITSTLARLGPNLVEVEACCQLCLVYSVPAPVLVNTNPQFHVRAAHTQKRTAGFFHGGGGCLLPKKTQGERGQTNCTALPHPSNAHPALSLLLPGIRIRIKLPEVQLVIDFGEGKAPRGRRIQT